MRNPCSFHVPVGWLRTLVMAKWREKYIQGLGLQLHQASTWYLCIAVFQMTDGSLSSKTWHIWFSDLAHWKWEMVREQLLLLCLKLGPWKRCTLKTSVEHSINVPFSTYGLLAKDILCCSMYFIETNLLKFKSSRLRCNSYSICSPWWGSESWSNTLHLFDWQKRRNKQSILETRRTASKRENVQVHIGFDCWYRKGNAARRLLQWNVLFLVGFSAEIFLLIWMGILCVLPGYNQTVNWITSYINLQVTAF